MRNHIIGATVILTTLLLPAPALTGNQNQSQTTEKGGIQPLSTVKISPVTKLDTKKDKVKQPATVTAQPFEIPSPSDAETINSPNQNSDTTTDTTPTQTANQSEGSASSVNQEPATPTKVQQSTGIQYR